MNTFETAIKAHIEKVARKDTELARKYEASGKDIQGCCKYIIAEARKQASNGCAVMTDAEVFGLAVHYFDEGLTAPKKETACRVETPADRPAPAPKAARKTAGKPKEDDVQMSLFNFEED